MLDKGGEKKIIHFHATKRELSFVRAYVKTTLPLLHHENKVFNLKSILATSQHRWRAMILLTSSWLLWNYSPLFLAAFTRASPFIVLTDSRFVSSLPSHFRRNSTLLLGRDIDRGFAAEKITAICDNVAPCIHSPYVLFAFARNSRYSSL